jgi:cephalosporin-C deacetylase-like acetyl esterase
MRTLSTFCLLLLATISFAQDARRTGPWDVPGLQAVELKPQWGAEAGKAREVYYEGEPFQGKPTRVFAYYAKPAGAGPFPAVVLVHGGGGKAFREWAEHWAARGYCAITMDLAGHGPKQRLEDGGPDQSDDTKFRAFTDRDIRDMWTYHAVANVLRAHTLLLSFPEVDKKRTAITGISWGGYLTCLAASLDDRFQVAVPVYGCGFLHENSVWKEARFDKVPAERREAWTKAFDPSQYLSNVRCPILFLNGTNDFAYPPDSYQKSYALVKSPKTISLRVRLPHGHIWTFQEVDSFIDSHLNKGEPLPKLSEMKRENDTVSATATSTVELKSAQLQKREWKSLPATLQDGKITAKLPTDRPLVYQLAVTDKRGLEVTTPHAEIDTGKK